MRFNVKFSVNKEPKFEVITTESKDKTQIYRILKKKYPDTEVEIFKIYEAKTASSEIL